MTDDHENHPPAGRVGEDAPPRARRAALALSLGVVSMVGLVGAAELGHRADVATADVPSYWNDIPMTCETTRIVLGRQDMELFRCTLRGGGRRPPAGVYDESETTWRSDITRRRAERHEIVITPSGSVSGWATY